MEKREQGLIYIKEPSASTAGLLSSSALLEMQHVRFEGILKDEDQQAELCDAAGISGKDLNDLKKLPLGSKVHHRSVLDVPGYIMTR